MREIALHLLDIAENSVAAGGQTVKVRVCEDLNRDRLEASVQDDGRGMDAEMLALATDPFITSRTTRKVGLGIPLLKAAAESCEGFLEIASTPGVGTWLDVMFRHSHIDRMPLGDLAGTLLTLVVAYPNIRWILEYCAVPPEAVKTGEVGFVFDSQPIRDELGDISFSEPEVLAFLREYLESGIGSIQKQIHETA